MYSDRKLRSQTAPFPKDSRHLQEQKASDTQDFNQ